MRASTETSNPSWLQRSKWCKSSWTNYWYCCSPQLHEQDNAPCSQHHGHCPSHLSDSKVCTERLRDIHGGLGQISDLANTGEIFEALTAEEISSAHSWLVDVSHLMLALAAASKLVILAAQVRTETWHLGQITTDNWLLSGWEFPDCSPRRQQSRRSINPARRDGQVRGLFLFLVDVNISLLSFRLESVSTWEFHSCYKIPGGCQSSLFSIQETISEKTSSLVGRVSRNSWWQAPG